MTITKNGVLTKVELQDIPEDGKFVPPTNITGVGNSAFLHLDTLKEVQFNSPISIIGNGAFANCKNLECVTFMEPQNLQVIGDRAFYNCTSLREVIGLSDCENLNYVGDNAFQYVRLAQVNLARTKVKTIGHNAFYNCNNLKFVALGRDVKKIKEQAFMGCQKLTTVLINSPEIERINKEAFSTCWALHKLICIGNPQIENTAFTFCKITTVQTDKNVYELPEACSVELLRVIFSENDAFM